MVTYAGGTGDSIETAIVIQNAASTSQGVEAEYRYVAQKFGPPGQAWELESQALLHHEGKPYDLLNIRLVNGTERAIYFDISAFFGKEMNEAIRNDQNTLPNRFLRTIKRLLGSS